jgi:hypothetical protein
MAFVKQHPNRRKVLYCAYATIVPLAVTVLALIAGTILPLFGGSLVHAPFNLIWGFVFGLGWYLAGFFASVASPWIVLWGALVWPVLICAALFVFSRKLHHSDWSFSKGLTLSIFALSLMVIVPQRFTAGPVLKYVPFYMNILGAVY